MLQGDSPPGAPPVQCAFVTDMRIEVYLTRYTGFVPGKVVQLRPMVIWPKRFTGSCAASKLCNYGTAWITNDVHPCDRQETAAVERCLAPTAHILAPTQISACAGTSLELDGSFSADGGAKLLSYTWSTTLETDNRRNVASQLQSSDADGRVGRQYAPLFEPQRLCARPRPRLAPAHASDHPRSEQSKLPVHTGA